MLKDRGRQTSGPAGQQVRRALVVAEIAIALILLVGSGLLLRTFLQLQRADLGFEPSRVLVGTVITPQSRYPNHGARAAFFDRLLERAAALPGVESAALTSVIPLRGDSDVDVEIEGLAPRLPGDETVTWYRLVSANYLSTIGIPLRRGRSFAPGESLPAVIVSETAARRFWPGADPIGRRVKVGSRNAPWQTVIGIAGDVRMRGAQGDARVEMYVPVPAILGGGLVDCPQDCRQPRGAGAGPARGGQGAGPRHAGVECRYSGPGSAGLDRATAPARRPDRGVRRAGDRARRHRHLWRDVVRGHAADRGDRRAHGARCRSCILFRLVAGDGVTLALLGIALGLAGSLAVGRSLGTLLYAVRPADPVILAVTAAGLFAVAIGAIAVPARRATRIEPLTAIRE